MHPEQQEGSLLNLLLEAQSEYVLALLQLEQVHPPCYSSGLVVQLYCHFDVHPYHLFYHQISPLQTKISNAAAYWRFDIRASGLWVLKQGLFDKQILTSPLGSPQSSLLL